jgi:hypothetical protein
MTLLGTSGTPAGVTADDAIEGSERLMTLIAITVKVYAVPLVSPETTHDVVDVVQVSASGFEITS